MKCSHCGASLPEGEMVCPVCGVEVQLVPNYETLDIDMMVEQNNMGEKANQQLSEQRLERKKYLRRKKLIRIIIALAIAAAAAVGIFFAVQNIRSNMEEAVVEFEDVYAEAQTAYENGEYQNAYNIIHEALNMKPDDVNAQVLKAKIAWKLENENEAMSILRVMVAEDPSCEPAYQALVDLFMEKGDYDALYELLSAASDNGIRQKFADYLVSPPVFSLDEGTWNEEQDVSITADPGAVIYLTLDKTHPNENSQVYSAPIHISEGETTIIAIAVNAAGIHSPMVVKEYGVNFEAPDSPVIKTPSGSYSEKDKDNKITVEFPADCKCYYSFDKKPTTADSLYTEPVEMQEGSHIFYAMLENEKGITGPIAAATFVYVTETPTPSPTQAVTAVPAPQDDSSSGYSGNGGYSYSDNSGYSEPSYSEPDPTAAPQPTAEPVIEPTAEPEPTSAPEPTYEPEPTSAPEPTSEPIEFTDPDNP